MSQASTRPVPMSGQAAAASSAAAPAGAAVPEPLHNKQTGSADKQTPFTSVAAKKTVWILQKVGAAHKKLEFAQEQCSGVKGDVGDDVGVGSIQEDETTLASRVAATAHDVGLQEDLLFLSDVVKSKLQAAKDVFDAQTVQFLDGHPFWKEEAEEKKCSLKWAWLLTKNENPTDPRFTLTGHFSRRRLPLDSPPVASSSGQPTQLTCKRSCHNRRRGSTIG